MGLVMFIRKSCDPNSVAAVLSIATVNVLKLDVCVHPAIVGVSILNLCFNAIIRVPGQGLVFVCESTYVLIDC